MAADVKKVFISSTYNDLVGYRDVAIETIRRFGWLSVAMEDFLSKDERPKDLCLQLVKKCDLYVGIFAHRYGYIPEGDNQSITEQEYHCARASGIECLIFIIKEDYPVTRRGNGRTQVSFAETLGTPRGWYRLFFLCSSLRFLV